MFKSKNEGSANYSYLLNICGLLYEEIFNKTMSSHSNPIRENTQLIEDLLKNSFKHTNFIILNFNLKSFECKILNSGAQLNDYINKNFYDLFPNQIKAKLISNFLKEILSPKDNISLAQNNNNKISNQKTKQYIETFLVIKDNEDAINYLWVLYLKLYLLFNDCIKENIILSGYFVIHKNTVMTIKTKGEKEKICGFGTKPLMKAAYMKKLIYKKFLEMDYMKNKLSKEFFSLNVYDNDFVVYIITENKIKKKRVLLKEGLSKQLTSLRNIKSPRKNNKDLFDINEEQEIKSEITENKNSEEINTNSDNIEENQKIKNLIEDNASQSSAMTKTSLSSFWNVNKSQAKDNQNNFAKKNL